MQSPHLLHLKRLLVLGSLLLVQGLGSTAGAASSGLDAPQPVGPYFNGVFPSSAPGDPSGWAVVNAFPNLTFTDPMMLAEIPGTTDLLVVGKTGLIWRFPNNPAATTAQRVQVLDWTAWTQTADDMGFYSLSFHPNFGQAGQTGENHVFVCYNRAKAAGVDDPLNRTYWTVSRFNWLPGSGTIDPASESILISQYDPHQYHNGGATFFGNDGFLYITVGDGGDGGDRLKNSQRINVGFFGGVLRIDVDYYPGKPGSHAIRRQPTEDPTWEVPLNGVPTSVAKPADWPISFSQGYGIPDDNPWLDAGGGVLEEFYAIGLRSPHSGHYDPVTSEIWVGDVGQSSWEELTRVVKGSNCQWAYKEADQSTSKQDPNFPGDVETPPVHAYDHSVGASIIGGMRYRGTKPEFSSLVGKVIFGDHVRGRIWSLQLPAPGGVQTVTELFSSFETGYKAGLSNFSTDSNGEIYMMELAGSGNPDGRIMKLAVPALTAEPPQFLSQTGVFPNMTGEFTNTTPLQAAPGAMPYDVANPLWSDNAEKFRWVILPNDGSFDTAAEDVIFSPGGNWEFPAGTVFVKHFEAPTNASNPAIFKRLETRFLVCTPGGGKYGITYKWNNEGTDAELLEGSVNEPYDYTNSQGGTEARVWSYPSRGDCMVCHNDVSGQALGVKTAHLNSDFYYTLTGRTANQLETLNALGVFSTTLTADDLEDYIEGRDLDDETAPLEHRVRSYIDMNCSHCHQPGAQGGGFDGRLSTPLDLQNLINGIPQRYEELGAQGRYIKPGNPALSAIHVRTEAVGNGDAMPPLAKNMAHAAGVAALQDYIESLTEAEFAPPLGVGPQARYVRLRSITGRSRFAAVAEFSILNGNGTAIPANQVTATYLRSDGSGGFVPGTSASGSPPSEATDGDPGSSTNFWQSYKAPSGEPNSATPTHPHFLVFDLQSPQEIGGFKYHPRTNSQDGRIYQYLVEYSVDGNSWTTFDAGVWANVATPYEFNPGYNKRPARTSIAGPTESTPGPFDMTVVFDMDVTGFTAADLQVTGGSVSGLRGGGYYYVASVTPAPGATSVSVAVAQNSVISRQGQGNYAASAAPVTILPDVTAPDSPPGLQASPQLLSVSLSWNEAPDDVATTAYEILRNGILLATIAGTTYEDTGLEPGSPHTYSVIALDAAGNRSAAATIQTTTLPDLDPPGTPVDLAGTPAISSILLSWTAPDDNVGVDEYQISRDDVVIATVQSPGYLDQGLEEDTAYVYKVVALDEAANASQPALLSVSTLADTAAPDAPGNLAGVPQLLSVQLSWDMPFDNVGVTGYRIRRGAVTLATIPGLSYVDSGLDSGTPYQYEVIALDAAGNQSAAATVTVTTLSDEDPPSNPENFAAVPGLLGVQLSWGASTDNVAVTGYRIHRNQTVIATVQSLSYHDTGLAPQTLYQYRVVALDGAGNSAGTELLPVTTLSDETAPSPPSGLAATPSMQGVGLSWSASTDDVAVTGYEVRRGNTLLGTVTSPGYLDSGLVPGSPYSYSVVALDAAGNVSQPATLNTTTLPDEGAPTAPVGLTATPSYHSVELTWEAATDIVGVTGYDIYRGVTFVGTTELLHFEDTGLNDDTAYAYTVIARDAAGNLSPPAQVATTTLGFEDWLNDHGLAGQTETDSDGGGLDNLTEFQLGFDPKDPADDLTFRLECVPQGGDVLIKYPDLKPVGHFHLHMSSSLHDLKNPANRINTITPAQIEAMAPAARSGHSVVVPSPGPRAFFTLVFEPLAD